MQIRRVLLVENLPKVFLLPDLNKISITRHYVDCYYYESHSGLTKEGCVVFDGNIHRTRGIFYAPIPPAFEISYRRKMLNDEGDIKFILDRINLAGAVLGTVSWLIRWDNYGFKLYDKYIKGGMYEFPILQRQGHLIVYNIPKVKEAYIPICQNNSQDCKLNEEMFEQINELSIYNHSISFNKPVMKFKELYVSPGEGAILYIPDYLVMESQSPDHEQISLNLDKGMWILLSHRAPHNDTKD